MKKLYSILFLTTFSLFTADQVFEDIDDTSITYTQGNIVASYNRENETYTAHKEMPLGNFSFDNPEYWFKKLEARYKRNYQLPEIFSESKEE